MGVQRSTLVQYAVAIIVNLGTLTAGAWLTWPSSVNKKLLTGEVCCQMTLSEIAAIVALMDLGNIISPIPSSYISNRLGRKPVIHSTALLYVVGSILILLADNVWYLFVARLIAGIAKGIVFAFVPLFLAEIADVKRRGALGTIFGLGVNAGLLYGYVLGAILPYSYLNIVTLVMPLLLGIALFFVPETPYFLVMKGKIDQAQKSLSFYRQLPKKEDSIIFELELIQNTVEADLRNRARFIDVATTKSQRRALTIVTLMSLAHRYSGISPMLAFSTLNLPANGGGASRESYMIIFSAFMFMANYIGLALIEKLGRKKLLLISTFSCGILNVIFSCFYGARSFGVDVTYFNWVPYATLLLFGFAWSLGLSYAPGLAVSELFPTNLKGHASSLTAIVQAINSLTINEVFVEVSKLKYGLGGMCCFFAISCIGCGVYFIYFIFETKGKSFQEIQEILRDLTNDNKGNKVDQK